MYADDREWTKGFLCGVVTGTMVTLAVTIASVANGAEIVGPDTVEPNRPIIFEIKIPDNAKSVHRITPQGRYTAYSRQVGNEIYVWAGQGEYLLDVFVSVVDFEEKIHEFETASKYFTVGNPSPPPDPDPEPDPTPDLTGLAKVVYEMAKKTGDKASAKAIADNYASIMSAMKAGAYAGDIARAKERIIGDLLSANKPITQGKPAWEPLAIHLADHMEALDRAGKLNTLDAVYAEFIHIEKGLREASK